MASLTKYDLSGKRVGEVEVKDSSLEQTAHSQMVKDYLVAIRNNARQWSANTKGRKEVNCTGRKPHVQKGQGRARQGFVGAPQYKGGGIVFGPKPKFDQHTRINRKERRKAIRSMLVEKIKGSRLHVLETEQLDSPQTKKVAQFLSETNLKGRRVLFLGEKQSHENLYLSSRNIPKNDFVSLPSINGYQLAISQDVVVLDSALDELISILG